MRPELEMGGLNTIAAINSRIAIALAWPPIAWVLQPAEQFALAGFDAGVCWSIARRGDRVITTAITEAGAAVVAELEPNDAFELELKAAARVLAKALRSIEGGQPILLDASFSLASIGDDVAAFEEAWGDTLRALA